MIERTSFPGGGPHLDDGELVRLLDGELGLGERLVAEAHIETCGRCRSARDRTAARTARVSSALAVIDERSANGPSAIPSPDTPSARWLRAAAIAALLVAIGALGSSTVRAWIAEGWEAVLVSVSGSAKPAADLASGPPGSGGVRARFVPHSAALLVRLENRAAGGVLTVEISADSLRSVVFLSRSEEGILVLPAALVIQNAPGSRADYRLVLPPTVAKVTAIVDADNARSPAARVREPWVVENSARPVRHRPCAFSSKERSDDSRPEDDRVVGSVYAALTRPGRSR